jgi:hypothetical protein
MHILILGNDPKTLVNFRGPLIEAMLGAGHRVTAAGAGFEAAHDAWFKARVPTTSTCRSSARASTLSFGRRLGRCKQQRIYSNASIVIAEESGLR